MRQKHLPLYILLAAILSLHSAAFAAIYQWSAKVGEEEGGQNQNQRVYLWIPEDCKRIRGLILDMQNVAENYNIDQASVREVCRQERIGILWVSSDREAKGFPQAAFSADWGWAAGLGSAEAKKYDEVFQKLRKPDKEVPPEQKAELRKQMAAWRARLIPQAEREFTTILKTMAEVSGYPEVEHAPVLTIGQSMSGLLCWFLPFWHPERMWGSMPMKTGVRGMTPDEKPGATMHGVPLLYLNQIEPEGPGGNNARMDGALAPRKDPENLVGRVYDWGGHHLDMLDGINQMLALFVKKAAKYRLADEIPNGKIPDLKPLTAAQGWLATSPFEAQFPMAPEKEYKGDKTRAFWYFDKEMAEAALNFRAENRKKKPQFVTLLDKNGKLLNPVEGPFGTVNIPRDDIAEDDGFTYRMKPAFFDKLIEKEKSTDKPAGHASNGEPVVVPPAAGNLVQVEKNAFRYRRFHRGRNSHAWFTIYQPGDAEYARISQPAGMWQPEEERKGREQAIDFPEIPNVLAGTKEIQLNAKSNVSGQVVEYYVISGPAELAGNTPDQNGNYPKYTGNTLRLAAIPSSAKYPVKVMVVAYQLGRAKEPFVQGAKEVVREFSICQSQAQMQEATKAADAAKQTEIAKEKMNVTLPAAKGTIMGGNDAKLDNKEGVIGWWSNTATFVKWAVDIPADGEYQVVLDYGLANDCDGTEVAVGIGGKSVNAKLKATGSWNDLKPTPIGKVALVKGAHVEVTLKCTKKTGPFIMNLRGIKLAAAPKP